MAKIHKIVDPLGSQTSAQTVVTDWSKCFLCQENTIESHRGRQGAGYSTITDLLEGFSVIDSLPKTLNLSRLDDGEGVEVTLKEHKAKWHDSCRLRYNKTKLQRAEKRKRQVDDDHDDEDIAKTCKRFSRRCSEDLRTPIDTCFFCGKPASPGRSLRWRVHLFLGQFLCSISLYLQNYAVVGILKINFDCSENNLH